MTAQSFTPGPWEAIQGGDGDWFVQVSAQPKSCHPAFDRYRIIHGWVGGDGTDNPNPELGTPEANAHLIASAPDMFEVLLCEEALDAPQDEGWSVLERYGWDSSHRFDLSATEFVRRLRRAAIAKVRGEVK